MLSGITESGFLWSTVWQSTLFLLLGLALSHLLRKRPARAHRVLLLAVGVAVIAPFATHAVANLDWGVFEPDSSGVQVRVRNLHGGPLQSLTQLLRAENYGNSNTTHTPDFITSYSLSLPFFRGYKWSELLALVWLSASLPLICRLGLSLCRCSRLISRAEPCGSETVVAAANSAATRLGLQNPPRILTSKDVRCPMIWCWGKKARIVLPEPLLKSERGDAMDWESIFRHELGHLKRRDHLALFSTDILLCIAPWQLALWWAQKRLAELSERVCDLWALDDEQSPTGYAESLLQLTPQRREAYVLPAVSGGKSLKRRITSLLSGERSDPNPGRRWMQATALAAICAVVSVALAQPKAVVADAGNRIAKLGANPDTGLEEIRIELRNLPQASESGEAVTPLDMALIPVGTFSMGTTKNVYGKPDQKEWPPHKITISKSFYIGKYELTQAQWEAVMGRKLKSKHLTLGPNYPAAKMSWGYANTFVEKLNRCGLGRFRLPTEAEWEYACRGGEKSLYFFGTGPNGGDPYMWWQGNYTSGKHHEVGKKRPNGWGLYDMHGNVSEWCSDVWEDPFPRDPQIDPQGPSPRWFANPLTKRVFRGIAYKFSAIPEWRFTSRHCEQQADFHYTIGMRLVREHP